MTDLVYIDCFGISALVWFAQQALENESNVSIVLKESAVSSLFKAVDLDQLPNVEIMTVNDESK